MGFMRRFISRPGQAGTASLTAIENTGERSRPLTPSLGNAGAVSFNTRDLEDGNASKGLPVGVGDGAGSWRRVFDTDLGIPPVGVRPHVGRRLDVDGRRSARDASGHVRWGLTTGNGWR